MRYLHPVDKNLAIIRKIDKDFDFKGMKFPVKIRDILKAEKKKLYQQ